MDEYFILVRRRRGLATWSWKLQRRSKPLGFKMMDEGFESWDAAKLAGEKALEDLLRRIAREHK